MITVDSLRACVRRFHDLYCELATETHIPKAEDNAPLHFVERRAYKAAVHKAITSLEDARVALATAIQRIEEGAAKSPSGRLRRRKMPGSDGGNRQRHNRRCEAFLFRTQPPALPA